MGYDWKAEEARAYLDSIRVLRFDIARAKASLETKDATLKGIDYSKQTWGGHANDALELAAIAMTEARDAMGAELLACASMQDEAVDAIGKMEDARYRCVLQLYYVEAMPWEDVADEMGYSAAWCKEMRDDALPLFWEVMPRQYRTMVPRAD